MAAARAPFYDSSPHHPRRSAFEVSLRMGNGSPPVFEALLGPCLDALPPAVRLLHREGAARTWEGRATVTRGDGLLGRIAGALTGLPPAAAEAPLQVSMVPTAGGERWIRRFGEHVMASDLRAHGGLLCERLGPNEFGFELEADAQGIRWQLRRVRFLGIPLPLAWFRGVAASEFERDGRYRFTVAASMPLVGSLISYDGWLELV